MGKKRLLDNEVSYLCLPKKGHDCIACSLFLFASTLFRLFSQPQYHVVLQKGKRKLSMGGFIER
jgi:hypothetical protein